MYLNDVTMRDQHQLALFTFCENYNIAAMITESEYELLWSSHYFSTWEVIEPIYVDMKQNMIFSKRVISFAFTLTAAAALFQHSSAEDVFAIDEAIIPMELQELATKEVSSKCGSVCSKFFHFDNVSQRFSVSPDPQP